ncbi:MAG: TolC family protein [Phycisphaerales bacterium]|nr:TolC family protein [Phycisphaerales bacterium]
MTTSIPTILRRTLRASLLVAIVPALSGCYASFSQIDDRVSGLLDESTGDMGGDAVPAPQTWAEGTLSNGTMDTPEPPTYNPSAGDLGYESARNDDVEAVIDRLEALLEEGGESQILTLVEAIGWSVSHGREYQYAMETYVIECLQLLMERHLWGPRFFDTIGFDVNAAGTAGLYQTSMDLVNEFAVTQKLPYGGQVSIQYLASFAKTLQDAINDGSLDSLSSGTIVLGAQIPLLRNAGPIAQENLIQAERDLTYAARSFEDFRRQYFYDIVADYLDLLVQRQTLANGETSVLLYEKLAQRQRALYEAGRVRLNAAAEAENNALREQSSQATRWERYRLALDRFKVRINWPVDEAVRIHHVAFAIDPPTISMTDAVMTGLARRLDLQTLRDQLVDRERQLRNSKNQLLPDLDLSGNIAIPSEVNEDGTTSFVPEVGDTDFNFGVELGIPLDREIEKLKVREAQVLLERNRLQLSQAIDTAAVEIRAAVREIDTSLFALDIQKRNVAIAKLNIESINADPDSVSVLNQLEAIRNLRSAEDSRAEAFKNLQLSIIDYLLTSGQLRIRPDGMMETLPGMKMKPTEDLSYGDSPA